VAHNLVLTGLCYRATRTKFREISNFHLTDVMLPDMAAYLPLGWPTGVHSPGSGEFQAIACELSGDEVSNRRNNGCDWGGTPGSGALRPKTACASVTSRRTICASSSRD
jgi:hypothetical protein